MKIRTPIVNINKVFLCLACVGLYFFRSWLIDLFFLCIILRMETQWVQMNNITCRKPITVQQTENMNLTWLDGWSQNIPRHNCLHTGEKGLKIGHSQSGKSELKTGIKPCAQTVKTGLERCWTFDGLCPDIPFFKTEATKRKQMITQIFEITNNQREASNVTRLYRT